MEIDICFDDDSKLLRIDFIASTALGRKFCSELQVKINRRQAAISTGNDLCFSFNGQSYKIGILGTMTRQQMEELSRFVEQRLYEVRQHVGQERSGFSLVKKARKIISFQPSLFSGLPDGLTKTQSSPMCRIPT